MFNIFEVALLGGTAAAQAFATHEAADQQEEILRQQELQSKMKTEEQSIIRMQQMRKNIAAATAEEAARGVSLASPSFKSVVRSSFNAFDQDEKINSLNLSLRLDQIKEKEQLVRERELGSILGIAGSTAKSISLLK